MKPRSVFEGLQNFPRTPQSISFKSQDNIIPIVKNNFNFETSNSQPMMQLKKKVVTGTTLKFTELRNDITGPIFNTSDHFPINNIDSKQDVEDEEDDNEVNKIKENATEKKSDPNPELKEIFNKFLSPTPFKPDNLQEYETQLEYLMNLPQCIEKKILLFPFYSTEYIIKDSPKLWEVSFKEHIWNTIKSMMIIKKLSPISPHIIEQKQRLTKFHPSGIDYFYKNRT